MVPQPTWVAYSFAVVMVAVSVYCIGRLLVAKRWDRRNSYDVNVSHVLMGLAMAGMLVPRWNLVPNGIWVTVFAAIALWFLRLSVRFVRQYGITGTDNGHVHHVSHYLIHMVMACAMLYMYGVGSSAGSGGVMVMGPATGARPSYLPLSFFFIAVLFGSAVWQLDTLGKFSPRTLALAASPAPTSLVSAGAGEARADREVAVGDRASLGAGEPRWLAPRLEIGCHICMCVAMGYMLVLML